MDLHETGLTIIHCQIIVYTPAGHTVYTAFSVQKKCPCVYSMPYKFMISCFRQCNEGNT
jgi:hypothetical protein